MVIDFEQAKKRMNYRNNNHTGEEIDRAVREAVKKDVDELKEILDTFPASFFAEAKEYVDWSNNEYKKRFSPRLTGNTKEDLLFLLKCYKDLYWPAFNKTPYAGYDVVQLSALLNCITSEMGKFLRELESYYDITKEHTFYKAFENYQNSMRIITKDEWKKYFELVLSDFEHALNEDKFVNLTEYGAVIVNSLY